MILFMLVPTNYCPWYDSRIQEQLVVEGEDEEVVVAVVGLEDEVVEVEDRGEGLAEAEEVLHVVVAAGVGFLRDEEAEDQEEVDLPDEVVDVVDSRSRFLHNQRLYCPQGMEQSIE